MHDPRKPTCEICQQQESVIRLFGYWEHSVMMVCKGCLRKALTTPDGGSFGYHNGKPNILTREQLEKSYL